MIEEIRNNDRLLGIVIRSGYNRPGISFFTPPELSQQVAYISHGAGFRIQSHIHNPLPRAIKYTQEVLVIRKGRLKVDFYDDGQNFLESCLLEEGDVIVLVEGGHGFEVLEDLAMIEIKQGPYLGDADKTRFEGRGKPVINEEGKP
jgi:mannose-6-phosphate isomerase-like protein (cupin superfamily)